MCLLKLFEVLEEEKFINSFMVLMLGGICYFKCFILFDIRVMVNKNVKELGYLVWSWLGEFMY